MDVSCGHKNHYCLNSKSLSKNYDAFFSSLNWMVVFRLQMSKTKHIFHWNSIEIHWLGRQKQKDLKFIKTNSYQHCHCEIWNKNSIRKISSWDRDTTTELKPALNSVFLKCLLLTTDGAVLKLEIFPIWRPKILFNSILVCCLPPSYRLSNISIKIVFYFLVEQFLLSSLLNTFSATMYELKTFMLCQRRVFSTNKHCILVRFLLPLGIQFESDRVAAHARKQEDKEKISSSVT